MIYICKDIQFNLLFIKLGYATDILQKNHKRRLNIN